MLLVKIKWWHLLSKQFPSYKKPCGWIKSEKLKAENRLEEPHPESVK